MKIYLAGLDAGHFRSKTNGYTLAAHQHLSVISSFFFYVDEASHAGLSLSLIPPKEAHENLRSAGIGPAGG